MPFPSSLPSLSTPLIYFIEKTKQNVRNSVSRLVDRDQRDLTTTGQLTSLSRLIWLQPLWQFKIKGTDRCFSPTLPLVHAASPNKSISHMEEK